MKNHLFSVDINELKPPSGSQYCCCCQQLEHSREEKKVASCELMISKNRFFVISLILSLFSGYHTPTVDHWLVGEGNLIKCKRARTRPRTLSILLLLLYFPLAFFFACCCALKLNKRKRGTKNGVKLFWARQGGIEQTSTHFEMY